MFSLGCARLGLIFCPFLPNFFLSNFFSFVAQAATGISLLVPSRGFVSGLRAAYLFLPDPCCRNLPAMRFVCAVLSCFGCLFSRFALFMRVFSLLFFHLFLPNLFLSNFFSFVAQAATVIFFLACPLPWLCFRPAGLVTCCFFADFCVRCLFCVVYAGFLSLVFLPFPA